MKKTMDKNLFHDQVGTAFRKQGQIIALLFEFVDL